MENIDPGWNFDNTYSKLSNSLFTLTNPITVKNPKTIIFNNELSSALGLNFSNFSNNQISKIFSGNLLPKKTKCFAQAYAGHQFGNLTMLGDGRAVILGEHINNKNERFDIQLKGTGRNIYSRNGDGRATLSSILREYLISESMYGLSIPTTRSLAVTRTGENVQREVLNDGAILTRVASSHIRIGTFQYLSINGEINNLENLVNYSLKRHFPNNEIEGNSSIKLLESVINAQIELIVNWMRVGFIHGVMNTDNMTISGETIDYGPCSFMDIYNPMTCYSSIDLQQRYAFTNQPIIAHWNLSRFAETLIPFFDSDEKKSLKIGENIINQFGEKFKSKWTEMMKKKLGLFGSVEGDDELIKKILNWMYENKADYTNTFCYLMNDNSINHSIYNKISFVDIQNQWKKRLEKNNIQKEISRGIMRSSNPFFIPRNHNVEKSIKNIVEENNFDLFYKLLKLLKDPYKNNDNSNSLKELPSLTFSNNYKTYCGT